MRYNIDIVESQIPKSNETGTNYSKSTFGFHSKHERTTHNAFCYHCFISGDESIWRHPPCSCTIISFMETCKHVYACPILRPVVQVECQIIQLVLQPEFTVNQLIIHGDCDDFEKFKKFCSTQVKGIVMQRSGRTFICPGI